MTAGFILTQMLRALAGIFSVYLLLIGVMALMQRRLIYLPERLDATMALHKISEQGLQPWPLGEPYRAVMAPPANPERDFKGTALIFHGNATSAYHFDPLFAPLQKLGWRVLVVEYPGYAGRAGRPSEHTIVADARETAIMARRAFGGPIMLIGISIGTGVATALASEPSIGAAVVTLITPFDTLTSVAQFHYPWLPVRLFLSERWDNIAALKNYGGTLNIVSAGHDKVMPQAALERLLRAYPHANHIKLPAATHNDWFWHLKDEDYVRLTTLR